MDEGMYPEHSSPGPVTSYMEYLMFISAYSFRSHFIEVAWTQEECG